jgi:hypothetical protein
MESKVRNDHPLIPYRSESPAWHPELLDSAAAAGLPHDFDLGEIWRWFHARLEWIGGMTPEQAHLTALLHWQSRHIATAIQAARLEANRFNDVDGGRKAYLEYLAADHLTQLALGLDPLPDLEPQPA